MKQTRNPARVGNREGKVCPWCGSDHVRRANRRESGGYVFVVRTPTVCEACGRVFRTPISRIETAVTVGVSVFFVTLGAASAFDTAARELERREPAWHRIVIEVLCGTLVAAYALWMIVVAMRTPRKPRSGRG